MKVYYVVRTPELTARAPVAGREAYKEYMAGEAWHKVYDDYFSQQVPPSLAERTLGKSYPFDGDEAKDVSMAIYKVLAGCSAMSIELDLQKYFTKAEINALWSVENLHHYLTHSASTLSCLPKAVGAA